MSPKGLVHILTIEEIDGELQALSNQGGEEGTGRYNLKHQQPPSHVDPDVSNNAVLVAVDTGEESGASRIYHSYKRPDYSLPACFETPVAEIPRSLVSSCNRHLMLKFLCQNWKSASLPATMPSM